MTPPLPQYRAGPRPSGAAASPPRSRFFWANLIVATVHKNLAIGRSVEEASRFFVRERKLTEGVLNCGLAVVRAHDLRLSCLTHALSAYALEISLADRRGRVLDVARN